MAIGFIINKKKHICIVQSDNSVIGAFEVMFDQRSMIFCQATSEITGYSIRKQLWKDLMDGSAEICKAFRKKIYLNYHAKIKKTLDQHKNEAILKFSQRNDYDMILVAQEREEIVNSTKARYMMYMYELPLGDEKDERSLKEIRNSIDVRLDHTFDHLEQVYF